MDEVRLLCRRTKKVVMKVRGIKYVVKENLNADFSPVCVLYGKP